MHTHTSPRTACARFAPGIYALLSNVDVLTLRVRYGLVLTTSVVTGALSVTTMYGHDVPPEGAPYVTAGVATQAYYCVSNALVGACLELVSATVREHAYRSAHLRGLSARAEQGRLALAEASATALLHNLLPPYVAARLLAQPGAAIADPAPAVTVLWTDMKVRAGRVRGRVRVDVEASAA